MTFTLTNQQARHILIAANGLARPPTGRLDLAGMIHDLGYVQIDTIRNVTRAHHHILWSRNQNYREPMLWKALKDRQLFEHFTHDASLLPMEFYPVWHWQFIRFAQKMDKSKRWSHNPELSRDILSQITAEGAQSTHAFDTKITGEKEMWARPPHKRALDRLWYRGELSTCHRENFIKYYDLPERVIPKPYRAQYKEPSAQFHWLCREALKRLVIATPAELQDFWGAASAAEIKAWLADNTSEFEGIKITAHDGTLIDAVALPGIEARVKAIDPPTSRLRLLNPFDPLIRNRKRLSRVFGFDYKIEIFVPAAQRRWGYYVYPLLEGSKFVGRAELACDRKVGTLSIANIWPEDGVKWTGTRQNKLAAETQRLRRFALC